MCRFGMIGYVHVELDGDVLGREAGVVAAGLVLQFSVHGEVAAGGGVSSGEFGLYGELVGIDI